MTLSVTHRVKSFPKLVKFRILQRYLIEPVELIADNCPTVEDVAPFFLSTISTGLGIFLLETNEMYWPWSWYQTSPPFGEARVIAEATGGVAVGGTVGGVGKVGGGVGDEGVVSGSEPRVLVMKIASILELASRARNLI